MNEETSKTEVDWQPDSEKGSSHSVLDAIPGVYIIFQRLKTMRIHYVYVGQSKEKNPSQRAKEHLSEKSFSNLLHPQNTLQVTWAYIEDKKTRDGVESWLADKCQPEIGKNYPTDPPIEVNHPNFLRHGMELKSDSN